jgi:hypothetical protein
MDGAGLLRFAICISVCTADATLPCQSLMASVSPHRFMIGAYERAFVIPVCIVSSGGGIWLFGDIRA